MGNVNWEDAIPRGKLALAHNRPPCPSTIERQIDSPRPRPFGLVVWNASSKKRFSATGSVSRARTCSPSGLQESRAATIGMLVVGDDRQDTPGVLFLASRSRRSGRRAALIAQGLCWHVIRLGLATFVISNSRDPSPSSRLMASIALRIKLRGSPVADSKPDSPGTNGRMQRRGPSAPYDAFLHRLATGETRPPRGLLH